MAETGSVWLDSAAVRLPRWMAGVSMAGALVALGSGHLRFAAGFAVGSGVAILAYWWLQQAVATALDSGDRRMPRGTMVKFAMRYPLLVIMLAVIYRTGSLSLRGVIAGLFVPLAGALIECLIFLARTVFGHGTSEGPSGPAGLEAPGTPPAQLHT